MPPRCQPGLTGMRPLPSIFTSSGSLPPLPTVSSCPAPDARDSTAMYSWTKHLRAMVKWATSFLVTVPRYGGKRRCLFFGPLMDSKPHPDSLSGHLRDTCEMHSQLKWSGIWAGRWSACCVEADSQHSQNSMSQNGVLLEPFISLMVRGLLFH